MFIMQVKAYRQREKKEDMDWYFPLRAYDFCQQNYLYFENISAEFKSASRKPEPTP